MPKAPPASSSFGPPSAQSAVMSFGDHLEDLRRRLILAILGIVPVFVLALLVAKPLLGLLIQPVRRALLEADQSPELLATNFLETFGIYVHLALVLTVVVGSPWILYQVWKFISPGLYEQERRFVYILLPLSGVLTCVGVLFLYYVIFPVVLAFFIQFGAGVGYFKTPTEPLPEGIVLPEFTVLAADPSVPEPGAVWINRPLRQLRVAVPRADGSIETLGAQLTMGTGIEQQYRISEYTKSFLGMAMGFALGFQTPVVVLLLGWAGLFERAWLVKYRKFVIMGCVIVAAVVTPADPISMVLLAVPLYGLFELGGWLLILLPADRVAGKSRAEGKAETPTREPDGDPDDSLEDDRRG
jgi:sec-independent protein translocase protein TatC